MPKDVSITLQTVGGQWETVGTDRARGVYAESLQLTSDRWGPSGGSFDLKRNPRAQFPDIGAYTPCDIEIGGTKVWAGRVKGTPSRDGADQSMNVQLEGWQAHLDDDVYVPAYVHTKLTDWKDLRSSLAENTIGRDGVAAGSMTNSQGSLTFGWPKGAQLGTTQPWVCAYIDLGPTALAKRVVMTAKKLSSTAGTGNLLVLLRGSDYPAPLSFNAPSIEDAIALDLATMPTSLTVTAGTFATPRRYLAVLVYYTGAAGAYTCTEDNTLLVSGLQVFTSTAYESGNASNLKADDVVRDALNQGTLLLSADRSQIDPANAVAFNIPELFSTEYSTPREVWAGVNAYHNFVTKIDEYRRPIFKALPAAAEVEVGEFSAIDFQDASQGSGEDIYNRVIVEAQTGAGDPQRIIRTAAQQVGAPLSPVTSPAINNPSAATNTTGWTAVSGTINRTTTAGEFDSAPAGFALPASAGTLVTGATTGTFKAGVTYVMTFKARAASSTVLSAFLNYNNGNDFVVENYTLTTSFAPYSLVWTPAADVTNPLVAFYSFGVDVFFDTLALYSSQLATRVDRAGFTRTKILQVNSALDPAGAAATQIGDTYLQGHKTTPFKGQIALTGDARHILTGRGVPPEQMLLLTNELIRLNHLIDPDTGAVGRDGRIVQVTYDWGRDQATIDLDSTSGNFESLIARLGAISGSGT